MSVIKEDMLIFVDSKNNNNKFYHMVLNQSGSINIRYGRVGNEGQTTTKNGGEREYNKIMREKIGKGYTQSKVSLENQTTEKNANLLELAMSQIVHSNEKVKEFIQRLVEKNIHNITTSTKISFNKDSNLFTTPLGPITQTGILSAKRILENISKLIGQKDLLSNKRFIEENEEYFKIIPTKIKNLRDVELYMLTTQERIDEQFDICEMLEQTMQLMVKPANVKTDEKLPEVFKVSIDLVKDKKTIDKITKKFSESKNSMHGGSVNNLKIANVYSVEVGDEAKHFKKELGNVMELWHGTRVANLLSILKSGLLMPKETPGKTTGAMFSTGLYFSDQSTKSLNYCDGMYYAGGNRQNKVYLFLADVAMGNYQVPKGPTSKHPDKGYHSYFAKANVSGVRNNEMIVFDVKQVRLKYILELEA